MDWLIAPLTAIDIGSWEAFLNEWVLYISILFLLFEFVRYTVLKRFKWVLLGDTVTNFVTFGFFIVLTYTLLGVFYVSMYAFAQQWAVFDISTNWLTVAICIVLADLAYYWEHRFLHRVNVGWATHTVHHSSPFFNISVAYRFGPMDGVWPIFFHLPLAILGFNPFVILFAEIVVQLYQTFLHTEAIKKLPKPLEWILNTPSHHRVHHGSNAEYLDKNYAGIFIIWDRLFGTFAEEREQVVYGLVKPIDSVNPFVAFFHGFHRLGAKVFAKKGISGKFRAFFGPPEWGVSMKSRGFRIEEAEQPGS